MGVFYGQVSQNDNSSVKRRDSTNKLFNINNLSGRRRGFTDERATEIFTLYGFMH